jgi:hypothetical protein
LPLIGGVVSIENDRVHDGVNRPGTRVVTFARILKHDVFPLCGILKELIRMCRKDLGFAVEIEFAVNLDADPTREPEFCFLQMRPLVAMRERCDLVLDAIPKDKVLCRSQRVLGNGRIEDLRDVLYIHPDRFDRGRSVEVVSALATANERLAREKRPYLLVGPGRWGSFDPWIGIPVLWHQISWAKVIVELPASDLPTDPSQGTHFFHNMTSAGIGYFSLAGASDNEFISWYALETLPGESVGPWLRHVRLDAPLSVRMDGQTQHGIITLS